MIRALGLPVQPASLVATAQVTGLGVSLLRREGVHCAQPYGDMSSAGGR